MVPPRIGSGLGFGVALCLCCGLWLWLWCRLSVVVGADAVKKYSWRNSTSNEGRSTSFQHYK